MANLADITDTHDFTEESLSLLRSKIQGGKLLVPRGHCLNCEAPIAPDSLYCDADCRADYEASEAIAKNTTWRP